MAEFFTFIFVGGFIVAIVAFLAILAFGALGAAFTLTAVAITESDK